MGDKRLICQLLISVSHRDLERGVGLRSWATAPSVHTLTTLMGPSFIQLDLKPKGRHAAQSVRLSMSIYRLSRGGQEGAQFESPSLQPV